jgi:glycosyltransferase involved in cell wall biosynthesis
VVVIDGSPDDSERIAREWAARDARISVVSVPNGGLGSARNVGLSHAQGKWVCFLDSDDELPPRSLELLRDAAEADSADVVFGTGVDFDVTLAETRYWSHEGDLHFSRSSGLAVVSTPELLHDHVAWAKLYRREFLEKHALRFSTGVHCEDLVFSVRALTSATSVSIIPEVVYRHRRHGLAISADYLRDKTLVDWMMESAIAIEFLQSTTSVEVVDNYLTNFIRRQWWSRMGNVDGIGSADLVVQFERFSAQLVDGLSGQARLELEPLVLSCLDFAASGGVSRRWRLAADLLNPLRRDRESWIEMVEAVIQAVDALDLDDPIEARLASALLIERASITLMRHGVRDDETRALKERIDALARVLPSDHFVEDSAVQDADAPHSLSPLDAFSRVLVSREPLVATATHASVTARSLTLRGVVRTPLEDPPVTRVWIVFRSQNSARVRAFPIWWSSRDDDAVIRWSATIELSDDMLHQQWKCWVRVQRGELPPRDIVLGNNLDDLAWRLVSTSVDDVLPVAIVFARSAVTIWSAERLEGGRAVIEPIDREPAPATVFTFPNWKDNPYLAMLQLEARARGRYMAGTIDVNELIAELSDLRSRHLVHLHWTSPITENATDHADAERRVASVVSAVKKAVAHGRIVVWTVHNVLPHDSRYPDAARHLHRELSESVSSIHTLSRQTSSAVSEEFVIPPDRETVIPHSSYHGVYGALLPRRDAKAALGASTAATSILFFGQIRPYKGLENLLGAVDRLVETEPADSFQLLVAGKPSPEARELLLAMEHAPVAVTSALRFIEDAEVSTWFSAADVVVAPYRHILNSGTMHLAATFGVPTVLPGLDHLREQFADEPWVRFFDTADPSASIAEALRSRFYDDVATRAAARDFARRYTPLSMARAYADYLDGLTYPLS